MELSTKERETLRDWERLLDNTQLGTGTSALQEELDSANILEKLERNSLPEHPDETLGSQCFDFGLERHKAEESVEPTWIYDRAVELCVVFSVAKHQEIFLWKQQKTIIIQTDMINHSTKNRHLSQIIHSTIRCPSFLSNT